ncbi:uncharacterized protein [Primulina eburnea]|uniref:uncharacterized protein n=1 Tax=Primulina eburnea TaxID=1245227 RepID=UPI003C6CA6FA
MDIQKGLPVNWTYFYQEKSMDELRHSLVLTMELEETRLNAQEELRNRDDQILQLKSLLNRAIEERDEAKEKCQNVFFQKLLLQQQLEKQQCHQSAPHSGISGVEDDPRRGIDSNNGFSSSDSDESIVSSPQQLSPPLTAPPPPPQPAVEAGQGLPIVPDRPLPEKGKLLQAVMKAGPLLQTLLLAGPLPRWRNPPPPLDTYQIPPPPVVIPSPSPLPTLPSLIPLPSIYQDSLHYDIDFKSNVNVNRKRGLSEGSDTSTEFKHPKVFFLSNH